MTIIKKIIITCENLFFSPIIMAVQKKKMTKILRIQNPVVINISNFYIILPLHLAIAFEPNDSLFSPFLWVVFNSIPSVFLTLFHYPSHVSRCFPQFISRFCLSRPFVQRISQQITYFDDSRLYIIYLFIPYR